MNAYREFEVEYTVREGFSALSLNIGLYINDIINCIEGIVVIGLVNDDFLFLLINMQRSCGYEYSIHADENILLINMQRSCGCEYSIHADENILLIIFYSCRYEYFINKYAAIMRNKGKLVHADEKIEE